MDEGLNDGIKADNKFYETHKSVPTVLDFLTIYGGLFTSISDAFYTIKKN
jgi:hypothetical protein